MRNKKLLFILIPILIVVLVLIVGVVYLKINSSPEKIFEHSISKVFEALETTGEQYSTLKGSMNLSASVESDDEDMQALNTILEGATVGLNMEVDTTNVVINENLNVIYDSESLLNASILLQDEKGYVRLPDYLNKYLEIPEYSELTEYYEKIATLDQNALMEAIKEELILAISSQELVQENTTLVLDGQETKVTASTLSLKDMQINTFYSELLNNLKQNEKFQVALGAYKEVVQEAMDEVLQDMENTVDVQYLDVEMVFTIYTKGFLNEFVGISAKMKTSYKEINSYETIATYAEDTVGLNLFKHSDGKYEFVAYEEYDGEREEALKVIVEDKKESKNKGTATIRITVDGEELVLLYNYETQGDKKIFTLSTEIEGVDFTISGSAVEEGNNVKGNFVISLQEETMGKINLNYAYNLTYGVEIQKVDTTNAVLIDELSEEDQTTLITNFQNSALYQLLEDSGLFDSDLNISSDEPEVTYGGYTVKYNVPDGFEASSYNSENYKMYMDEDYNSIYVTINWDSVDSYMSDLDDTYVLTSDFYENQKISDERIYTVNGKEYKLRTITYNDEYGKYVDLYFAYELDDEYCYVVEVETEGGNISMDLINYFLDVTVVQEGLMPTDNIASTGAEIIDLLQ